MDTRGGQMSEGHFDISCGWYAPSAKYITHHGKPIMHIDTIKDMLNKLIEENRELRVKQVELMKELQTFEQLYSYTKEIYRYTNLDLDLLKKEGTGYWYDVYKVTVGKLLEDNKCLRKEAMDSLRELILFKRQHDVPVSCGEQVRLKQLEKDYEYLMGSM